MSFKSNGGDVAYQAKRTFWKRGLSSIVSGLLVAQVAYGVQNRSALLENELHKDLLSRFTFPCLISTVSSLLGPRNHTCTSVERRKGSYSSPNLTYPWS
jgi:hypothetical protein